MRRTRVKILLAFSSAIAVTAVVFGSANGSSTSLAVPAQGSIDSAVAGTPEAGKAVSSPAKMHGRATPVRVPPLRDLKTHPTAYAVERRRRGRSPRRPVAGRRQRRILGCGA